MIKRLYKLRKSYSLQYTLVITLLGLVETQAHLFNIPQQYQGYVIAGAALLGAILRIVPQKL